jgi:DNA-binding Lrp family transcriptional regulator
MDDVDRRLIAKLQGDIPLTVDPYRTLADHLGVSEETVIVRLQALSASGKLKRIGAVLRHQNSGYAANAMVVFKAPPDEMERLGKLLAESPLVSNCYERASCAEWPYTLYAMMHDRNMETIEEFVRIFALEHGVERFTVLESREELKKASMLFFGGSNDKKTL